MLIRALNRLVSLPTLTHATLHNRIPTKSQRGFWYLLHVVMSEITKIIRIQIISGTKGAFFSASHCFSPLVGLWGGTRASCVVYLVRTLFALTKGGIASIFLVYHIPTFCGALYLSSNANAIRLGLPLICFLLFAAHPMGNQAIPYTFYWWIPMLIALSKSRSIFVRCLGSTFTTHAVGSVIWLYYYNLGPTLWYSLIPIVWLERLILALGMTLLYHLADFLRQVMPKAMTMGTNSCFIARNN